MSSNTPISEGCQVTLHFSLTLQSGETIDSNFETKPASFWLGDGSMLPGFEEQLLGLKAGMVTEVELSPENAFGEANSKNIHRIPKGKFTLFLDDEYCSLESGAVVSFKDPAGFDIPGVVKEKTESAVIVDFNHPLASKDIIFKAEIIAVTPAATDKIEVKL